MTVMVSDREYYRIKFVYLLPEHWWEASGVAANGLITQNSNRTAQSESLITLDWSHQIPIKGPINNYNSCTHLQNNYISNRQQLSQVSNHITIYLDSTKLRQMIKIIYRYTDQHANHSCRWENGDTKFVRQSPQHYLLLFCFEQQSHICHPLVHHQIK